MIHNYSLKANLKLMLKVFYQPYQVISFFLNTVHPMYWLFPILIATIMFEGAYVFQYMINAPIPSFAHTFARIINIQDHFYDLLEIFLFPIISALTFLIFGLLITLFSRKNISGLKTTIFMVFIFGTIGILAFFLEYVGVYIFSKMLNITQPIIGIIYMLYAMEFMRQQSGISRWKTLLLSLVTVSSMLYLRLFFLG